MSFLEGWMHRSPRSPSASNWLFVLEDAFRQDLTDDLLLDQLVHTTHAAIRPPWDQNTPQLSFLQITFNGLSVLGGDDDVVGVFLGLIDPSAL